MSNKKMNAAAEAVKEDAAKAVDKLTKEISKAAQPAKDLFHEAAEKAEPAMEKAKTAVKNAEPMIKSAGESAVQAGKKVASALIPEVYVQLGENEFTCTDIVERCKADFRAKYKAPVHSCRVYIKPEDAAAYYVINMIEDKIDL